MSFANRFTKQFQCRYPIVLPPMGGICGPKLVSAFANCGGIGFLGTGGQNKNKKLRYVGIGPLIQDLNHTRELTQNPEHTGIGFLIDDQLMSDSVVMDQIMRFHPTNIWFSAKKIEYLVSFMSIIQDSQENEYHQKPSLFVQVDNPQDLVKVAKAGADVIIVRGKSAGGGKHLRSDFKTQTKELTDLVRESKALLESLKPPSNPVSSPHSLIDSGESENDPLLVVAGGIHSGRVIAECIRAGADGVCLGSMFAVCEESELDKVDRMALTSQIDIFQPDGSMVRLSEQVGKNPFLQLTCRDIFMGLVTEAENYRPS